MELRVCNCPSQDLGFTNCVFLHQQSYAVLGGEPSASLHIEINGFVFQAKQHDSIEPACVGMNSIQRRGVAASAGDAITASVHRDQTVLSTASLEVDFIVKGKARGVEQMDGAAMSAALLKRLVTSTSRLDRRWPSTSMAPTCSSGSARSRRSTSAPRRAAVR